MEKINKKTPKTIFYIGKPIFDIVSSAFTYSILLACHKFNQKGPMTHDLKDV